MSVVGLAELDAGMVELAGGKATGLGELLRRGERVPEGFCVTTDAQVSGVLPERELLRAYRALGPGPVAVRSSGTAEDLPDASFAGQQDTFLGVEGEDALLDAVRRCWDSLGTERAVAYRAAAGIGEGTARMAVVVQRMVDARVAGVLFTANPVTGCRTEMVVDAAEGLGTAVVDGTGTADHYVLDAAGGYRVLRSSAAAGGCLDAGQLRTLGETGARLQRGLGSPQDIEWAVDAGNTLWLLQSRPITTLFPNPPQGDEPRVYMEGGNMQGMVRPFTPMGMDGMRTATRLWCEGVGVHTALGGFVGIGGRMYIDLTGFVRSRYLRRPLLDSMQAYGPRVASAMQAVLADPRFAPRRGLPFRLRTVLGVAARIAPGAVVGLVRALVRPSAARRQAFQRVAELARPRPAPAAGGAADWLRRAEEAQRPFMGTSMDGVMWPLMAGMLAASVPATLLDGVATAAEVDTALGGLPYNVTTEMDLALWRLAVRARPHRELLSGTPPTELAARYRAGMLPDIGLTGFLAEYGHRAAAEVDVGVPRWAEDPAPVFAIIANYLRITDPGQAPDRRFRLAAARGEEMVRELAGRGRRARPVRGRLAAFLLRRARELAGLRELGKFAWLYTIGDMREHLLQAGGILAAHGVIETRDDVMYLDFEEAHAAARGTDQRELIARRKAAHQREQRRRNVPVVLLSDGTVPEALAPRGNAPEGAMTGMAAAPGRASGRARVVHDPNQACIEPGEILVAATTDPGWTPLFLSAVGLVTETGSPVAHGPTVAREYGIPAVICVRDATTAIRTGQLLTVDGAAGTVTIEDANGTADAPP